MKHCASFLGSTLSLFALAAAAQHTPKTMSEGLKATPCDVGADGPKFSHVLNFAADTLSYGPGAGLLPQPRGVSWLADGGAMTITIHRPTNFSVGGKVRIPPIHPVTHDAVGTIKFNVTPMGLNSGNSVETYGSQSTNTIFAAQHPAMLREQSRVLALFNRWNPDNDWRHLALSRQGSDADSLRVMSISNESLRFKA